MFMLLLMIGTSVFAKPMAKLPTAFIPSEYIIFSQTQGDLNKDGQSDYVFIIKGTNKKNVVMHDYRGELDRNPRGIIIAFKKGNEYELVLDKRNSFSSENEDGGVYFAPELDVSIEKGNLVVHYAHGRYGYWRYIFRYQQSDFELIGYDSSQNRGPVIETMTSINFMTKKMVISENMNQYSDKEESGDEKFKDAWKKFTLQKRIKLRDIAFFDDFDVYSLVERGK